MVTATQRIEIAALRLSAKQVIDTTAAGNSFSAGYLAARLQGADVTPAAAEAIRQMRAAYPDLLIGAGTVLNREQVVSPAAIFEDALPDHRFLCSERPVVQLPQPSTANG